jgi:hypothetical protein
MATYQWDFGSDAQLLKFNVVYDSGTNQFTVTVLTGSMNLNALYWNDGDNVDSATTGLSGFSGAKSENSLNMNGTGEVWDGGMKISDAGLGKTPPPSYMDANPLTSALNTYSFTAPADFNPLTFGTLGVRATSTSSAEGSIKWIDDSPNSGQPPPPADIVHANDDSQACGVEGLVPVTGNVLTNDTDSQGHDLDVVSITYTSLGVDVTVTDGGVGDTDGVAGTITTAIDGDNDGVADGVLTINTGTGAFTFNYSGELAVGEEWEGSVKYTITDGNNANDSVDSVHTATVELCVDAAAASHGYWSGGGHDFSDSEGIAGAFGSVAAFSAASFDDYFNIDSPTDRTWTIDPPGPTAPTNVSDITFAQAISYNDGQTTESPSLNGGVGDLVREATTAVLNFYDADSHDAFVTAYEAQFGSFADADNDAAVLADLRARVETAIETPDAAAPFLIDTLAAQLHLTHE